MNELMKDFLSTIIVVEAKDSGLDMTTILTYTDNKGQSQSKPASTLARMKKGSPGKIAYDKWRATATGTATTTPTKKSPERIGSRGDLPPKKGKQDKKEKKPKVRAITADHGITDTDTAASAIQKLINAARILVDARRRGIAGIGGPVPSYGEASLTDLANRLTQGGLQQGLTTFREENRERVDRNTTRIQKVLNGTNKREKNDLERKIKAVGTMLGLDPATDKDIIVQYLATRDAYAEEELGKLKADKNSIFYRSGKAGFGGDEAAVREWANAAFDGAVATTVSMQGSLIDSSRPFTVIQSDTVPGGYDQALLRHLAAKRDAAAEGSDERKHYDEQIKAWEVAKFHDTMVVGEDSQGRMVVFHVTNKKGDDLKDIWNNSSPSVAMGSLLSKFKAQAESEGGGLTVEEKAGFVVVARVLEQGVSICEDASAAATSLWSNPKFTVDDDVVAAAHALRKPRDYVGNMGEWMDAPVGPRSSTAKKDFDAWSRGEGKKLSSAMSKACAGKGSTTEKCTAARMRVMDAYMKTTPGSLPPYNPVGKLLVKIGEEQIKRDKRSKTDSTGSLGMCAAVKRDEKSAVEKAHSTVVSTIQRTDADLCKKNPASCKPNGPATRMYLEQLMHSMHFDIMAENWDSHLAAVTGGRASRPSDFRQTLAERSGYSRDNPEPTTPPNSPEDVVKWRRGLEEHIINNATISADSGAIRIRQGGESGEEYELIQDSWRTSGSSQKVQKNVGDDVRTGVILSADDRRRDSADVLRDSLR